MDSNTQLTKEVVAQEARFLLETLVSAAQYAPEVTFEDLQKNAEQQVSLKLLDYVNFLERFGYISFDRNTQQLGITPDGQSVVSGEKVAELVIDVVHHFRPILSRNKPGPSAPVAQVPSGSPSPAAAAPAAATGERYQKVEAIGSGGIGTVYLAQQVALGRQVALKELREVFGFFNGSQKGEIVKRFDEEVRRAAQLTHPNVVAVIDCNTQAEFPYVVTEYVGGASLRRVINEAKEFPPELCVKIFLQLLHALKHAHDRGVLHRGLKPENVLFDEAGNVRVTDFGLSRVVERDQSVIQHVYVGSGSVAYMAPELFNDPGNLGTQSDLYALGIILYEMLAGKLPGRRSPMPTKLHPTLPAVVDDIFDKLTQDEREERYSSADEVLADFHRADVAADFMEPMGTILFTESPIAKLEFEAPAVEQPATAEEAPAPAAPQPAPAKKARAAAPAAKGAVPAAKAEAPAEDPSTKRETEAMPVVARKTGSGEAEAEGDDPSGRKRRRRPYSFQQRIKDRDS